MFDFLNPALREGKRRAREEYKQRMLQGKIDEAMRHAREKADRKLAGREKMHRNLLELRSPRVLLTIGGMILLFLMLAH